MNLKRNLSQQVEQALKAAGAQNSPAIIRQSGKPEYGHYQANGIMGAAKKLGKNPLELAQQTLKTLVDNIGDSATFEIAGPGFINVTFSRKFITDCLTEMANDKRLGVIAQTRQKVVVDYSSPNLAKEMHIGHLRSTAIGDANVRIMEFLGHHVIRANHVGDWGAQFGSLLAYMDKLESEGKPLATELKDLEVFYQRASEMFKTEANFARKAREFVVRLQSGDEKCLELWKRFISESIKHCQAIYDLLDISLSTTDVKPESAYNGELNDIITLLEAAGLIELSDGAKCVFLPEFVGKDDEPLPAIIQKSDGGFPYIATDLAAVQFRAQKLAAHRTIYFVDGRQSLHFAQLFAIARAAGFIAEDQEFRHVPFGSILNKDGKPYKTREGGAVKLATVAEEAINRAQSLISDKNAQLSDAEKEKIARVVGIGAIKYAELSKNRTTDYIFDWDTMLSFEGNTAPYLQYAYTRIVSIFRHASITLDPADGHFDLDEPTELALALKLLQYPEAVENVTEDFQANILCNYLFELAGLFSAFYENCPVLKADESKRSSRLKLCGLSGRVLQHGLGLLGISTVEQM